MDISISEPAYLSKPNCSMVSTERNTVVLTLNHLELYNTLIGTVIVDFICCTCQKDVIFSPVSVCLSLCLLTGIDYLKTADQIFMKFNRIVGHNPRTNLLTFK